MLKKCVFKIGLKTVIFSIFTGFSAKNYIQWALDYVGAEKKQVNYIGRKPAASPATGYLKKHLAQQKEIIEKVLS